MSPVGSDTVGAQSHQLGCVTTAAGFLGQRSVSDPIIHSKAVTEKSAIGGREVVVQFSVDFFAVVFVRRRGEEIIRAELAPYYISPSFAVDGFGGR